MGGAARGATVQPWTEELVMLVIPQSVEGSPSPGEDGILLAVCRCRAQARRPQAGASVVPPGWSFCGSRQHIELQPVSLHLLPCPS